MEEIKTNSQIELAVNKAIDFLAPYFKMNVNDEKLKRINRPKVRIETQARYNNNIIFLPRNAREGFFQVGHEVGHWFHDFINPKVAGIREWESTEHYQLFVLLTESVAFYSEGIYTNKEDVIQNPRFSLLELSKMNFDEAKSVESDLIKFFWEIVPKRS